MSTAGYLQDAKNQQKRLAETITAKGITATATEKYKDLVDKVAQIENLKGEERTLENFTNVLSEPKSVVQLEYPEPKNLFNQVLLTDWGLVLTDGKYVGSSSKFNGKTLASNFQNNNQYTISLKGYNTNSTQASVLISVNYTDGTSATIIRLTAKSEKEYKFTSAVGKTVSSFKSTYYNADTVNISYIQIEEGADATAYEPYPAPKILNAKLGSKNLLDPSVYYSRGSTFKGITYTVNNDTVTMTGIAKASLYINILSNNPDTKLDMPEQLKNKKLRLFAYGNTSTVEAVLYDEAGTFIRSMNSNTSATDTTGCSKWSLRLRFNNGQTYNDTIKIMICEEGVEDSPSYTPYISDLTTVIVTRCGKNLLDPSLYHNTATYQGMTYTTNGDTVTLTGTATASLYLNIFSSNPDAVIPLPNILQNKKIKLYAYGNSTTVELLIKKTVSKTVSANTNVSIDTTGAIGFSIRCRFASGNTYSDFIKLMICVEEVENDPAYELYKTPTEYTPTASGEVTGITNLYPTTTLLTDNAGVVFEQVTGGSYKEILPSTDKNGITKVYQPSVDSTIDSNITSDNIKQGVSILGVTGNYICNYTYDETTKELVLIL